MGSLQPRDFVYFVVAIVAVWFGTSLSAREIVRERPVYRRERMVNLGLIPYLASKLFVLGIIVGIQCILLWVPLKFFDLVGLMPMPGEFLGLPQLWTMLLTAAVGIAIGLLVSAIVRSSEMATGLVPLILIPQLLFAGLAGVPRGIDRVVTLAMPAAWSFDTMKRFSTLDTLEAEGAEPNGETEGKGLYKFIESENEKTISDAKGELDQFKKISEERLRRTDGDTENSLGPPVTVPATRSGSLDVKRIPTDLSRYVTFLNPWMNDILNQVVLMLMFGALMIAALIALKLQDLI